MSPTPATIAERALSDIHTAERQMRQQAEAALREYVSLLNAIARYFAGQALEETRRDHPTAASGWGPAQWKAFFEQHVLLPGQPYLLRLRTWGGEPPQGLEQALKEMQEQIAGLNKQLAQAGQAKEAVQSKLKAAESDLAKAQADYNSLLKKLKELTGAPEEAPPDAAKTACAIGAPFGHAAILEALSGWEVPRPSGRTSPLAYIPEARWEVQSMALYLLAAWGISARPEIESLLGQASGTGKRTTLLRGALDNLVELELAEMGRLAMEAPFSTALLVMRLSEKGQELCQELGWQIAPSDWERLSGLPETQQLCSLAFANQARRRGYRALALPPPLDGFQADVLAENEAERSYVLVGTEDDDLLARWQSASKLSVQLGLCAAEEVQRSRLAEQIRAAQPKAHGAASDLQTLLLRKEVSPDKPLWLEIW